MVADARAQHLGGASGGVVALWSLFHWSRAESDSRSAVVLAVVVSAAAIGAATMDLGGGTSTAAKLPRYVHTHTLHRHTGMNFVPRSKR